MMASLSIVCLIHRGLGTHYRRPYLMWRAEDATNLIAKESQIVMDSAVKSIHVALAADVGCVPWF